MGDRARVIALPRRLVPPQRETGRVEAIQPEECPTGALRLVEQRLVQRHILGTRQAGWTDGKAERRNVRPSFHQSLVPPCPRCLSLQRAHRPPPAGTRTPGSGRRMPRPPGPPTATLCAGGGPLPRQPPAPARRGGLPPARDPPPGEGGAGGGGN